MCLMRVLGLGDFARLTNVMTRLLLTLLLQAALSAVWAQQLVTTRVFTEPAQARFYVDGQLYDATQMFTWPEGSKHTIEIDNQYFHVTNGTSYMFKQWSNDVGSLGEALKVVVTASRNISFYRATLSTAYLINLRFMECAARSTFLPAQLNTVVVDGNAPGHNCNADLWFEAGTEHTFQATPGDGMVFLGWTYQYLPPTAGFHMKIKINRPAVLYARFSPGRQITLFSDPPELLLAPDNTPTLAPLRVDWAPGTRHVLAAVSPQQDSKGRLWVFSRWSNGMGQNAAYLVPNFVNMPESITGYFVPGAKMSFVTQPTWLRLRVSGQEAWPSYNFTWGVGEIHEVHAPSEQTDAQGRRWRFRGWSNNGPQTQHVPVLAEHAEVGVTLVATYEMVPRVELRTSPTGIPISVDGQLCRVPCVVDREPGTTFRVSVPQLVEIDSDSRLEFNGWNDGGTAERSLTMAAGMPALTASFRSAYRLYTSLEPAEGGQVHVTPANQDGFYPMNSVVTATVETRPGYRFRRWEGDVDTINRTTQLTVYGPSWLRASLERAPEITNAGIRNAAGETPHAAVAPGSIVAIMGAELTTETAIGPASPLRQLLGGVVVRLGDRVLPLFSVGPERIDVLFPADLSEGRHEVTVHAAGQAPVTGSVEVTRNAPGLFNELVEGKAMARAFRPNGTEVTRENPARRGEIVTLHGTGFGPYSRLVPHGFAVPASPAYPLADPIDVIAGETIVQTVSTQAAVNQVGVVAVRVRTDDLLSSGLVPLKVRVNGRESNTVLLPVE